MPCGEPRNGNCASVIGCPRAGRDDIIPHDAGGNRFCAGLVAVSRDEVFGHSLPLRVHCPRLRLRCRPLTCGIGSWAVSRCRRAAGRGPARVRADLPRQSSPTRSSNEPRDFGRVRPCDRPSRRARHLCRGILCRTTTKTGLAVRAVELNLILRLCPEGFCWRS